MAGQANPFLKQLVSSDKKIREEALQSLHTFLGAKRDLSETDLLKLWKGLFYCMWMTDKPRVQQRLAADLVDLIDVLPQAQQWPFVDAFWKIMLREWHGLDRLRLDKFLMLVRLYLRRCFKLLDDHEWELKDAETFNQIMSSGPLNPSDPKLSVGLAYHLLDIYWEELEAFVEDDEDDAAKEFRIVLSPVKSLASSSQTKMMKSKAKDVMSASEIPSRLSVEPEAEVEAG